MRHAKTSTSQTTWKQKIWGKSVSRSLCSVERIRRIDPAVLVAAICILAAVVVCAPAGFESSDDSYYFKSALDPMAIELNPNLFGFALHPLLVLSGSSMTQFRLLGILVVFLVHAAVIWTVMRDVGGGERARRCAAASVAGAAGLGVYAYWLHTPGYNWLAVVSASLAAMGHALLCRRPAIPRFPYAGLLIISLSGFLAALSRPPVAVLLGLGSLGVILATSTNSRDAAKRTMFCICATLAIAALWLLPFAGPGHFAQVLRDGLVYFTFDQGLHRIPVQLSQFIGHVSRLPAGAMLGVLVLLFLALPGLNIWPAGRWRAPALWVITISSLILAATSVLFWHGNRNKWIADLSMVGINSLIVALGLAVAAFATLLRHSPAMGAMVAPWIMSLTLLVVPPVLALGGNNLLVSLMPLGSGLFLLAALVPLSIVAPFAPWLWHVGAVASLFVAIQVIGVGMLAPYRLLEPVWLQTERVKLAIGGTVRADERTAAWIADIQATVTRHGFKPGTPMLDYTGRMPGITLITGASSPIHAWVPSGYVASQRAMDAVIRRIDDVTLAQAWLVTPEKAFFDMAPLHKRLPPTHVLEPIGTFERPYDRLRFTIAKPRD